MTPFRKATRRRRFLRRRIFTAGAWLALSLLFIGAVHGILPIHGDDCKCSHVDDERHEPDTPSPRRNGASDCAFCELMYSPALALAVSSLSVPLAASVSYAMPASPALHPLRDWRPDSPRAPPIDSFK
ncbi:MAG: DUF2946 family protein [Candidatus Hydrogenedentota bacterium]